MSSLAMRSNEVRLKPNPFRVKILYHVATKTRVPAQYCQPSLRFLDDHFDFYLNRGTSLLEKLSVRRSDIKDVT